MNLTEDDRDYLGEQSYEDYQADLYMKRLEVQPNRLNEDDSEDHDLF